MRRQWQRLVACVSLAAFLVANSHAGMALAAHLSAARPSHAGVRSPATSRSDRPECPGCCRCAKHKSRDTANNARAPQDEDGTCGPSCPHCPKTPSAPKCPCPGGCALCSVAKVPHVVPTACLPWAAPCLGAKLPEPRSTYTPPCAGRLIRPPRA